MGLALSDRADHIGRNHRGNQAESDLGERQPRAVRGYRDVAGRDKSDGTAVRCAIHYRNGRLRQSFETLQHQGKTTRIRLVPIDGGRAGGAHFANVSTGAEHFPRARQLHDPD